jgi:hypothetical protein
MFKHVLIVCTYFNDLNVLVKEHSKLFPVKFSNFLRLLVTNVDTAILIQNKKKKSKPKNGGGPPIFKNESHFQKLK